MRLYFRPSDLSTSRDFSQFADIDPGPRSSLEGEAQSRGEAQPQLPGLWPKFGPASFWEKALALKKSDVKCSDPPA